VLVTCCVQDFYIVEAKDQVFIAASHLGGTVTLYLSNGTGQFYVKSLDHVVAFVHPDNFFLDLYEVSAITTFSFCVVGRVFKNYSGPGFQK